MNKHKIFFPSLIILFLVLSMNVSSVSATDIITEDFESCNMPPSGWTSVGVGKTCSNEQPHHDTYSMKLDGSVTSYIHQTFSGEQEIYSRTYVYIDSETSYVSPMLLRGDGSPLMAVRIGSNYWQIWYYDDGGFHWGSTHWVDIALDTWQCFEISYKRGMASDGWAKSWLNETQYDDYTGLDNDGVTTEIDQIWYGGTEVSGAYVVYFDCFVLADTYIGEEAVGEVKYFFGVINQELTVESTETWSLTRGMTINQQFAIGSYTTWQFNKLGIINLITSIDSKTQIAVMKYVFGQINQLFSLASYRTWSFRLEGTINPTFSIESIIQIVPSILNFYGDITQSFQIVQWNDLKPEINLALIVAAFALIMAIIGITFAVVKKK